ncbi:MAG: iron ABC transporter substrate-binding protein, partial [Acidimicrobiia bacterium]
GALLNVAGGGILVTSKAKPLALRLFEFLHSEKAQRYFRDKTFEYPLAAGVDADPRVPPIASLSPPDVDLSNLADLRSTLELLSEVGIT